MAAEEHLLRLPADESGFAAACAAAGEAAPADAAGAAGAAPPELCFAWSEARRCYVLPLKELGCALVPAARQAVWKHKGILEAWLRHAPPMVETLAKERGCPRTALALDYAEAVRLVEQLHAGARQEVSRELRLWHHTLTAAPLAAMRAALQLGLLDDAPRVVPSGAPPPPAPSPPPPQSEADVLLARANEGAARAKRHLVLFFSYSWRARDARLARLAPR
jgi:hypothetical protein